MMYSIPSWIKELVDKVNQTGGAGMPGILQHFEIVNRIGLLVTRSDFLLELTDLVNTHEARLAEREPNVELLRSLSYPKLTGRNWRPELRTWMQTVLTAFLGSDEIQVPEPPALNRAQRRAFKKYGLMVLFVPAITETQYPSHVIKPAWGRYLNESKIQRIELFGRWVAIETIPKSYYQDDVCLDDVLMKDIGIKTRFAHPHSGKGEGDNIIEDLLPKIAWQLSLKQDQSIDLPTAEIWNFVGNLFNWLTANTQDNLPDLGSTPFWEWVKNSYGLGPRLIVGYRDRGGLASVRTCWRTHRHAVGGFRVLVVL